MARFTTLYSGSSGNSALVEENGRYLLVDMGKSCRMTQNALKGLGLPLADLGGILVTHEHSDHVSGLAIFLKYHPVPVYGSAATLDYLACRGLVPPGAELIDIDGRTEDVVLRCRALKRATTLWPAGVTASPRLWAGWQASQQTLAM